MKANISEKNMRQMVTLVLMVNMERMKSLAMVFMLTMEHVGSGDEEDVRYSPFSYAPYKNHGGNVHEACKDSYSSSCGTSYQS